MRDFESQPYRNANVADGGEPLLLLRVHVGSDVFRRQAGRIFLRFLEPVEGGEGQLSLGREASWGSRGFIRILRSGCRSPRRVAEASPVLRCRRQGREFGGANPPARLASLRDQTAVQPSDGPEAPHLGRRYQVVEGVSAGTGDESRQVKLFFLAYMSPGACREITCPPDCGTRDWMSLR